MSHGEKMDWEMMKFFLSVRRKVNVWKHRMCEEQCALCAVEDVIEVKACVLKYSCEKTLATEVWEGKYNGTLEL